MAKTSVLTIMIQLAKKGDADRSTIKGLAEIKQNVGLAIGAFTAFTGAAMAVGAALNNTVQTFVSYAAQVRELNRLTGAGAEETSRIIQAADDMTISYEDLQKALWFASKNGVEVNIESLARLADQYIALEGPAKQAEFLAKNFGKGGAEMGKLLEKGGAGVKSATAAISENLVLTDEAVQSAREYEIAVDNLKDSWEGVKVAVGSELVPILNALLSTEGQLTNATNALSDAEENHKIIIAGNYEAAQRLKEAHFQAVDAVQAHGDALMGLTTDLEVAAGATTDAADAQAIFNSQLDQLKGFIGGDLTEAWKSHNEAIAEYKVQLGQAKTEEEKRDIQSKIDAETDAYNKRAASLMFNIQQEAILAGVQAGGVPSSDAIAVLGDLANAYGLIDERQKNAMSSSANLVAQWTGGEITTEQLTNLLESSTLSMQDNSKAADKITWSTQKAAEQVYHVGQRAEDTESQFLTMKEAQQALADGINKGAAPAVGNLKTQINGLPADGSTWNWFYSITGSGKFPNSGGSLVPRCFIAGTLITMGDGTQKPIETVAVGDVVQSYDVERGELVQRHVTACFSHSSKQHLVINDIGVTPEHIVWSHNRKGWLPAGALVLGDEFMNGAGDAVPVISITTAQHESFVLVYNFEVEEIHTYFANNVLVHNAKAELASGGQLGSGWTVVGEQGPELISPWGYVFSHATSREMVAGGIAPQFARWTGGDITSGIFSQEADVSLTKVGTKNKTKSKPKGGASPVHSSNNSSDDVVASAVQPMADVTAAAIQSSAAAQQQAISEGIQTRKTIEQGNGALRDELIGLRDDIQRMNATMKTSIVSAVQQAIP